MKKSLYFSILASLFFFNTLYSKADPVGDGIEQIPIFDAHMHYKEPAWEVYPVQTVIELMDKNRVAMALVSSTPDEGTIRLYQHAPDRIVPELRPYYSAKNQRPYAKSANSSNWTKAEGMLDYIKERLHTYDHAGIGEFHIHRLDRGDKPLLTEITKLAKMRNIPIHIHSGAEPVEFLYSLEPNITIIWAHAGMSEPPRVVDDIMTRYPNTYVDTSYREMEILAADNSIDPDWRRVIDKHTDRFMVGTDTWINDQWEDYTDLIKLNRLWLKNLPREQAEKIAYKNALRLFKRTLPKN
ncbi:MAG: amidohydrolase [Sneathiellales bacterium]|nr:amidohydrolase [Sneathiellales bacterium]